MWKSVLSVCAVALWWTGSTSAQDLNRVVDGGLAHLRDRQAADGSYGDAAATLQALRAFRASHRGYGEEDGPFLRNALAWLAKESGERKDLPPVAVQRLLEVLDGYDGGQAAALAAKIRASYPDHEAPPERAVDSESEALRRILARDLADWPQGLEVVARAVRKLARHEASVTVPGEGEEPMHWSQAISTWVLRQVHGPEGMASLDTLELGLTCEILGVCAAHLPRASGGGEDAPFDGHARGEIDDLSAHYRTAAQAALKFLDEQQENGRYGFMGRPDAGITAMAVAAYVRTAKRLGQPIPESANLGLDWLRGMQHEDGSIHEGSLKVYVTSAAVMAMQAAGRPEDADAVARAVDFLKVVQADEGEGYDSESDWAYGGIGYGDDLRPDLSNTQFGLEALKDGGVPADDPAFQRAIAFLQKCQNQPEVNSGTITRGDGREVRAGTDGGAMYYPGDSKAGLVELEDGTFVARSYGSMTYALLKCYLFCGLPLDDPRVKAALGWIQDHYTLEYNPGFDRDARPGSEYQGLFYYYYTMAKALDASGMQSIRTPDGVEHAWREELARHLLSIGFKEGFWSNRRSERWWEELPVLATSYSLVALDHCLSP